MYISLFLIYLSVYIFIKSEFISSCSRPAVGSNIVQITGVTFFVNVFKKMAAGSHHFLLFQINTTIFLFVNFFTKWLPAAILDVRNSLSMAFLAISDQCETLICLELFNKMAAVGHFGCPKFIFDHISGHFRSIRNFIYFFNF